MLHENNWRRRSRIRIAVKENENKMWESVLEIFILIILFSELYWGWNSLEMLYNEKLTALLGSCFYLLLIGALWGFTNPFMKKGSKGVEKIKASNKFIQYFHELKFLVTSWKYVVPYTINLLGGVMFYFALANLELTLVVPLVNAFTYIFTAIMEWYLGEARSHKGKWKGVLLIIFGMSVCFLAKSAD